jgi:hypothetical protein
MEPQNAAPEHAGPMTGRCLCGAVTFTAEGVELANHYCHCGMCRRWSSSGFMGASTSLVTFSSNGELARYESSPWAERGFCRNCGTTLFYFLKPTQSYTMSVGAFDDDSRFHLVREIFVDHKPPGHEFAGDHPRWTEEETMRRLAPPGL